MVGNELSIFNIHLRTKTRKLFNTAKHTGDWQSYKSGLTIYNNEISLVVPSTPVRKDVFRLQRQSTKKKKNREVHKLP